MGRIPANVATPTLFGGCDARATKDAGRGRAGGKAAALRAPDAQGLNNSEACRLVAINRKTGNRWRYGRTVLNTAGEVVRYPPVKIAEPKPRSARSLSEPERIAIADRLAGGETVRAIARGLGRSPSTISREVRRNSVRCV
jgi:Helix-turn-helix domain